MYQVYFKASLHIINYARKEVAVLHFSIRDNIEIFVIVLVGYSQHHSNIPIIAV